MEPSQDFRSCGFSLAIKGNSRDLLVDPKAVTFENSTALLTCGKITLMAF